ncbi:MAG: hypothetical protein Q8Q54_11760 [Methylococcales bacterium]|nr:hypothetical protein [Methylococcales bacterium]
MMHTSALKNSLLLVLLGTLSTVVVAEPLDKTAIKTIALKMDVQALDDLGVSAPPLQEKVIYNLNEWRFPMVTGTATHSLEVSIGKIENSTTPVGFSFSSGNSDPRSLAFQRDDVLPVTCRLIAQKHPAQHAELTMSFSAEKPVKAEKLADHISTVCFDLLDDLHFLAPETTKTLKTPAWMPTVKVETVPEPQPKVNSAEQPIVPAEERKQLIIQNQGSPLILKMGHDR